MKRAVLHTLVLLGAATLLAGSGVPVARAYVRTVTVDDGNPIHWTRSCVFITPSTESAGGLAPADVLTAIHGAADAWNAVSCSYMQLVVGTPEPGLEAGFHQDESPENVIVFQDSSWPYDPSAAALTTITYLSSSSASSDGQVVDADVEINGWNFDFATDGDPTLHDLQNVLTHELGHVLGLDHTCDDGMIHPTPVDHTGAPVPSCFPTAQLPPEVTQATMYNFAAPGEQDKRSLEPDDQAGLCAIYPTAEDPQVCEPVPPVSSQPTCNCSAPTVTPGAALPWLLVIAVMLGLGRRRRRRQRQG